MIDFKSHIEQKFPVELKLLIFLSQANLNGKPFAGSLNHINWDEFFRLATKHRLVSHILKHTTELENIVPAPTIKKLTAIRLEHSKQSLNFTTHAIRLHQKFEEENIEHCFFKGPLLSLELYRDVGFRNFKDIDVLVKEEDAEKAKEIIEELDFRCIYPRIKFTKKQKQTNYKLSHHYAFIHPIQSIEIELHWSLTNPKSFYSKSTNDVIANSRGLKVSNYTLPYISEIDNIVFQASHGAIHQWYRLFWLKDFSVLISKTNSEDFKAAYELSKKLKLKRSFLQACFLSSLIYNSNIADLGEKKLKSSLITSSLKSINTTGLTQKGIGGKLRFVLYRFKIKPSLKYHFDLLFRLRTHLTDWEIIRLNDSFFFLYYLLRPFLLIYKFFFRK